MILPPRPTFSRRSVLHASGVLALRPVVGSMPAQAASTTQIDTRTGTEKFLELMGYVDKAMEELGVPSVGVAVVDGDKRHTCALGITSIEDPQLVDAETMFRIGDLSRLFTGSAIGALVENGTLAWEAPLRSYLPGFAVQDAVASETLTVMDVLTHRSGLDGTVSFDVGGDEAALSRYVEAMSDLPSFAPPGDLFGVGEADGILAGHLVAEMTGLPFETAMRELTLDPLSMDQSSFNRAELGDLPIVRGHTRRNGTVITIDSSSPPRVQVPVRGLFSNLNELLHFASYHAFASSPPTFITAPTREAMHRSLGAGGSVGPLRIDAMGVAWMISEFAGTRISVHASSADGHSAMMIAAPSNEFAVIVLTNADFAQDLAIEVAFRALELFTGLNAPQPTSLTRPEAELRLLEGVYAVTGGFDIRVSRGTAGLRLDAIGERSAGASLSGALTFVSPLTAMIERSRSRLFVDFVMDRHGEIRWLRHMGQLAPRIGP